MLKNIKFYLENESRIDFYGLFSLLVFFIFFSGLLIYVYRMKKSEADEVSQIPLQDGEKIPFTNTKKQ
jgi:cbb3-type cytochrome oxidase subunit 3